ncbi:UvrD-helicase-domain-containing protein [Ceraceosorus guamensis]|uniref:DNA 3'-5' helicase n=1 Tax=Ceraceosorus guamensis TaxID=1522189 RepID=A0A316VWX2_9BASI|nr:UvrD-helicase-domain-containing protein [Ceraceosorus guamensis]PWN41952.1 UvrD-helicase-domain-containing protein [Ceraceosorus guamensis]
MTSSAVPSRNGEGSSSSRVNHGAAEHSTNFASSTAYLSILTESQRQACTSPPAQPLQILAGPGSGKTRVLTSRAAWLVLHHKIMPESIVMITFTNKAAREMRSRLEKLIGTERTGRLVLGTFHAVMARYLRRHGRKIGLANNFSILDADDSKKVLKEILKEQFDNAPHGIKVTPDQAATEISKAKSKGYTASHFEAALAKESAKKGKDATTLRTAIADVYVSYEQRLEQNSCLDFDDLLLKGCKLLQHKEVVDDIVHVLVDEFQDTNVVQYDLMQCFAAATTANLLRAPGLVLATDGTAESPATPCGLSIVGDPDQSIYLWRSAEIENLNKMTSHYPMTMRVNLEENFRSAGNILDLCLRIIEQDKERIKRGLRTSHPLGVPVVLKQASSAGREAQFIATEIKRLIAHTGGLLGYADFAILLRFNALSREVEKALQQEGLPSKMLGGSKFFDRVEVKDLLAYLTLAANPNNVSAFVRVVNVPKRSIGDKSVQELLTKARELSMKPMELAEQLVHGTKKLQGIKPAVTKNLKQFVDIVARIRRQATKGRTAAELLETVLKHTNFEDYLRKLGEHESRWENVKELINFAEIVRQSGVDDAQLRSQLERTKNEAADDSADDVKDVSARATQSVNVKAGLDEHDARDSKSGIQGDAELVAGELSAAQSVKAEPAEERTSHSASQGASNLLGKLEQAPESVKAESDDEIQFVSATFKESSRSTKSVSVLSGDFKRQGEALRRSDKAKRPKKEVPSDEVEDTSDPQSSDGEPDASEATQIQPDGPLAKFLEACTLSTDMHSEGDDEQDGPKVTISTAHAAKGLEFPVVFVLGVEDGSFPRAQTNLYLTHAAQRHIGGQMENTDRILSQFISPLADRAHRGGQAAGGPNPAVLRRGSNMAPLPVAFSHQQRPVLTEKHRRDIAVILERRLPSDYEETVSDSIAKL